MEIEAAQHFLILGAQKAGTTALYDYLGEHPDVCMSIPKEPVFFESEFERGIQYYRERYFSHWKGERVVGEARTHNLGLPFVPERIHALLPDAKLIAILRDPIDRAYAEWWHGFSRGEHTLSFEEALEENFRRIEAGIDFSGPDGAEQWRKGTVSEHYSENRFGLYLDLGYYARQLDRYRSLFSQEQIRVLLLDDLIWDPERSIGGLWSFLGVHPAHRVQAGRHLNPARNRVRSPAALAVLRHLHRFPGRSAILRRMPAPLVRGWKRFAEGRTATRPPMKRETERWLLKHFEPHNRALEALLGRSLSTWFEPRAERAASHVEERRESS